MKLIRLSVISGMLDIKPKSRVYKFKFVAKKKFYKMIDFTLKFIASKKKFIASMESHLRAFYEAFK